MTSTEQRMAPPTPDPRCGTRAGYKAHWRREENSCEPCRVANSEEVQRYRELSRTSGPKPPTSGPRCGSPSGPARHARRGEALCPPCLAVHRAARREKSPVGQPRPPRPSPEALADAACYPWTGLHDSKRPDETNDEFKDRLEKARAVCHACPVFAACLQLREHYRGRRTGIDGILAGRPTTQIHRSW